MAVIMRLARRGSKRRPFYHIVAADSRFQRDGRFLEQIGYFDPRGNQHLTVDEDKAKKWLAVGASTSPAVKKLLKRAGVGSAAPVAADGQ